MKRVGSEVLGSSKRSRADRRFSWTRWRVFAAQFAPRCWRQLRVVLFDLFGLFVPGHLEHLYAFGWNWLGAGTQLVSRSLGGVFAEDAFSAQCSEHPVVGPAGQLALVRPLLEPLFVLVDGVGGPSDFGDVAVDLLLQSFAFCSILVRFFAQRFSWRSYLGCLVGRACTLGTFLSAQRLTVHFRSRWLQERLEVVCDRDVVRAYFAEPGHASVFNQRAPSVFSIGSGTWSPVQLSHLLDMLCDWGGFILCDLLRLSQASLERFARDVSDEVFFRDSRCMLEVQLLGWFREAVVLRTNFAVLRQWLAVPVEVDSEGPFWWPRGSSLLEGVSLSLADWLRVQVNADFAVQHALHLERVVPAQQAGLDASVRRRLDGRSRLSVYAAAAALFVDRKRLFV